MTSKLNQIIAIEKGIKARSYAEISDLHKAIQKPELFNGFSKTYASKAEDGDELPAEAKRVQFTVRDVLATVARSMGDLISVTARKDWTNCDAAADVVVDGKILVAGAPVTFLLFLEKQLVDLRTFASNLPTLDHSDDWTFDENSGLYRTQPTKTHRTRKEQRPIVLYDATPEHPAQTQLITVDEIAGFWTAVKHSGAMPAPKRTELIERIDKLLRAVKEAREAANNIDETRPPDVAALLFGYLSY